MAGMIIVYYIVVLIIRLIGTLRKGAIKGVGLIIKHLRIWIPMGEQFNRFRDDRRAGGTVEIEDGCRGISTAATS